MRGANASAGFSLLQMKFAGFTPGKTEVPLKKLNAGIVAAFSFPEMRRRLTDEGIDVMGSSPVQLPGFPLFRASSQV